MTGFVAIGSAVCLLHSTHLLSGRNRVVCGRTDRLGVPQIMQFRMGHLHISTTLGTLNQSAKLAVVCLDFLSAFEIRVGVNIVFLDVHA